MKKKIVGFIYINIMKFPKNELISINDSIFSSSFFEKIHNVTFGQKVTHHSHVTDKVFDYAHTFCSQKVKENNNQVSAIAHSLFGFDFFSFYKVYD